MRSSFRQLAVISLVLVSATATAKSKKPKTQLALDVQPTTALVYVDGRAQGKAAQGKVIDVTPGLHVVRLVFGRDEHEEQIKFVEGKATKYTYEFEGGEPAGAHPAKETTPGGGAEAEPAPGIQPTDKSAGSRKGPPQPEDDPTAGGRWPAEEESQPDRAPPPPTTTPNP
jgi:hypothetical protein